MYEDWIIELNTSRLCICTHELFLRDFQQILRSSKKIMKKCFLCTGTSHWIKNQMTVYTLSWYVLELIRGSFESCIRSTRFVMTFVSSKSGWENRWSCDYWKYIHIQENIFKLWPHPFNSAWVSLFFTGFGLMSKINSGRTFVKCFMLFII